MKSGVRSCNTALFYARGFSSLSIPGGSVHTPVDIYCNPPYSMTAGHYAVEFKRSDHKRLRDKLAASRGKWMVSYNDCEFIRELYSGYYITSVTRINNLAQRYDGGCEYPEVIITNYDPKERENASPQLNLFDQITDHADPEDSQYEIE